MYFARNILSAVTPQIVEEGIYTEQYIGAISSTYFTMYAVGQLINGIIGDRFRARTMLSAGLILAGVCNLLFPFTSGELPTQVVYGLTGFFLSMIYAPMTRVVAENTEPIYATRCSLGYTFASFFGSPLAGLVAVLFTWQTVFYISSGTLFLMGAACFFVFLIFERKGIVTYNRQQQAQRRKAGGVKALLRHDIIQFTVFSGLTGVVRTSVVFWLPTYFAQYLDYTPKEAASLFTITTLIISTTAFITVFIYERLGYRMELTVLLMFIISAAAFGLAFLIRDPLTNITLIVLAIMANNGSSTMVWSRYCPSLCDTGMVSTATGFLDFTSYMCASLSSTLFADAIPVLGWKYLILIWMGLMLLGALVAFTFGKKKLLTRLEAPAAPKE